MITPSVAVLGAGLQGTTVALELARRGCRVDLYDRHAQPITQAGFQNEGKLHLGFVYANDPSLRTARRLAEGALCFLPLIRRWAGATTIEIETSRPFLYAVPTDSMLSPEEISTHFARVEQSVREIVRCHKAKSHPSFYPGIGSQPLFSPLPETRRTHLFAPQLIPAAFSTAEVAVNPISVAVALRAAVGNEPLVRFYPHTHVESVSAIDNGYDVTALATGELLRRRYDSVVNALWDGRLRIDHQLGLVPDRSWLWRYKVGLRFAPVALTSPLESVTFMLGPYGDTVHYGSGLIYLSWYPDGLLGLSSDLAPPASWSHGTPAPDENIVNMTLQGLAALYPQVDQLRQCASRADVVGGVIFAWGQTDIDDPDSELHNRYDIGVVSRDGYHTMNTGKYTMGPMLAMEVADRILPDRARALA